MSNDSVEVKQDSEVPHVNQPFAELDRLLEAQDLRVPVTTEHDS